MNLSFPKPTPFFAVTTTTLFFGTPTRKGTADTSLPNKQELEGEDAEDKETKNKELTF